MADTGSSGDAPRGTAWAPAAAAVAGAALGIALLSAVFPRIPNDMERTRTILDALRGGRGRPADIVVFGSSICMSGIDAGLLSADLGDGRTAWNLSSTGQSLYEALMLTARLPDRSRTVVLGVSSNALAMDRVEVVANKIVAYRMYGWEPTARLLELVREIGDPELRREIERSRLSARLDARWIVKAGIDTAIRRLVRKDLGFETAMTDLLYPQPYSRPVAPEALEKQISAHHGRRESFRVSPAVVKALDAIARLTSEGGRKLILVVLPEHPKVRALSTGEWERERVEAIADLERRGGFDVVDAHGLLGAQHFIDHVHLTAGGAEILTRVLASHLAGPPR